MYALKVRRVQTICISAIYIDKTILESKWNMPGLSVFLLSCRELLLSCVFEKKM
jgi:hypothetical protein